MSVREPNRTGSTPRSGRAYPGGRGPAWSARAFAAIILAIVAVALVIWFASVGKSAEKGAGQQPCTAYDASGRDRRLLFLRVEPRAARLEFARPGSENAHETYKFPGTAPNGTYEAKPFHVAVTRGLQW